MGTKQALKRETVTQMKDPTVCEPLSQVQKSFFYIIVLKLPLCQFASETTFVLASTGEACSISTVIQFFVMTLMWAPCDKMFDDFCRIDLRVIVVINVMYRKYN